MSNEHSGEPACGQAQTDLACALEAPFSGELASKYGAAARSGRNGYVMEKCAQIELSVPGLQAKVPADQQFFDTPNSMAAQRDQSIRLLHPNSTGADSYMGAAMMSRCYRKFPRGPADACV